MHPMRRKPVWTAWSAPRWKLVIEVGYTVGVEGDGAVGLEVLVHGEEPRGPLPVSVRAVAAQGDFLAHRVHPLLLFEREDVGRSEVLIAFFWLPRYLLRRSLSQIEPNAPRLHPHYYMLTQPLTHLRDKMMARFG